VALCFQRTETALRTLFWTVILNLSSIFPVVGIGLGVRREAPFSSSLNRVISEVLQLLQELVATASQSFPAAISDTEDWFGRG